jgi:hypothetical protein
MYVAVVRVLLISRTHFFSPKLIILVSNFSNLNNIRASLINSFYLHATLVSAQIYQTCQI